MAKSWTRAGELRSPVIGFLAMIGILFLMESVGMTQQTVPRGRDVDGFRELKWGTSIEQASKTYIEYWFKGNRLLQVRAVLHSNIGPRTLVTRAENAFGKISALLREQHGSPSDDKVDYVTEFIVLVKEATWIVDHSAIVLKYEGAGGTKEDRLTLILQDRPVR